jgi:hypothetical protein
VLVCIISEFFEIAAKLAIRVLLMVESGKANTEISTAPE